jgi:hypothetical protein
VTFQFSGNYRFWCDRCHLMIWFVPFCASFKPDVARSLAFAFVVVRMDRADQHDPPGRPRWCHGRGQTGDVGPIARSGGNVKIQKEVIPTFGEGQHGFLE